MNFLYRIVVNDVDVGNFASPDEYVSDISEAMGAIFDMVKEDNERGALREFCRMAGIARDMYFYKNIAPGSVEVARDLMDAITYLNETLSEASGLLTSYLKDKYGNLIKDDMANSIIEYVTENDVDDKIIEAYITTILPKKNKKQKRRVVNEGD